MKEWNEKRLSDFFRVNFDSEVPDFWLYRVQGEGGAAHQVQR